MKKIVLLFLCISNFCFSQNDFFNEDGTVKNDVKRKMFLETMKKNENSEMQFDIEDRNFVVITNSDCGDKKYDSEEMRKRAMFSSFQQLLNQINIWKRLGYSTISDIEFEGIIFKTNTLCMATTRRYHFKFNLSELISFPEYMDLEELINYVVVEKKNKNIIFVKNP